MRPGRQFDPLLVGLLAVSLTANVVQILATRAPTSSPEAPVPPDRPAPAVGAVVPDLSGWDLEGWPTTIPIGHASHPTLIYVFTTECPWCKRNIANVNALASAAAERFRVIGLALEDDPAVVRTYADERQLRLPSIFLPDERTRVAYGLGRVPMTLLVDQNGKVSHRWDGAFSRDVADSIPSTFDVELPGLAAELSPGGRVQ